MVPRKGLEGCQALHHGDGTFCRQALFVGVDRLYLDVPAQGLEKLVPAGTGRGKYEDRCRLHAGRRMDRISGDREQGGLRAEWPDFRSHLV